ncbi:hypothetical protein [Williamsoniiplasma lucivorax]|uniref:sn-glycerol-3-phosphate ABC transporter substrate-binding protein n=1 Tax=Williamsoniiplasma lucivorax TaxID=209274 RepID=A0A2S5RE01_9MOLU|nr:hypothetical protein [Williamsoniiplasma lucivorax]PPE05527.1 sn-glycerol-3-phosphate ABC transporter substrate-binding protein [Williamsoniiplasma lucivorax]
MFSKFILKRMVVPVFLIVIILGGFGATLAVMLRDTSDKNVILQLDANVMKATHESPQRLKKQVEKFNEWNKKQANYEGIDAELVFTSENNLDNKIYRDIELPSLYISYSNTPVKYEKTLPKAKGSQTVVDVGQVLNWNQDYLTEKLSDPKFDHEMIKSWASQANQNVNDFISSGDDKMSLDQLMGYDIPNNPAQNSPIPTSLAEQPHLNKELNYYNHFAPFHDVVVEGGLFNNKLYAAPWEFSMNIGYLNTKIISEFYYVLTGKLFDQTMFPMSEFFIPPLSPEEDLIDVSGYTKQVRDLRTGQEKTIFDDAKYLKWRQEWNKTQQIQEQYQAIHSKIAPVANTKMRNITVLSANNKWKQEPFKERTIQSLVEELFAGINKETPNPRANSASNLRKQKNMLRNIFTDVDNVELFTYIYSQIGKNILPVDTTDKNLMQHMYYYNNFYSFGWDFLPDFFNANALSVGESLLHYQNDDPKTVYLDKKSQGLLNGLQLYQTARKISEFNGTSHGGKGGHPGTIFGAAGGYGSSYFGKGSMMGYSVTSAASDYLVQSVGYQGAVTNKNNKPYFSRRYLTTYVHYDDVILHGSVAKEDTAGKNNTNPDNPLNSSSIYRGQRIGMFKQKSVKKNRVAAKLLNYLLTPAIQSESLMGSAYLPVNKFAYNLDAGDRLGIFKHDWLDGTSNPLDPKPIYWKQWPKDGSRQINKLIYETYIGGNIDGQIITPTMSVVASPISPFGEITTGGGIIDKYMSKFYGTTTSNDWDLDTKQLLGHFWTEMTPQLQSSIEAIFGVDAKWKEWEKK